VTSALASLRAGGQTPFSRMVATGRLGRLQRDGSEAG